MLCKSSEKVSAGKVYNTNTMIDDDFFFQKTIHDMNWENFWILGELACSEPQAKQILELHI